MTSEGGKDQEKKKNGIRPQRGEDGTKPGNRPKSTVIDGKQALFRRRRKNGKKGIGTKNRGLEKKGKPEAAGKGKLTSDKAGEGGVKWGFDWSKKTLCHTIRGGRMPG